MKYLVFIAFACIIGSCQKENITTSGRVNDHFFLQNKGAKMPVGVIGNLDSNKLVILVHGGHGASDGQYKGDGKIEILEKIMPPIFTPKSGRKLWIIAKQTAAPKTITKSVQKSMLTPIKLKNTLMPCRIKAHYPTV